MDFFSKLEVNLNEYTNKIYKRQKIETTQGHHNKNEINEFERYPRTKTYAHKLLLMNGHN